VPGPTSLWRDVRTYQNYMYTISEGGQGIQVISLAQVDSGIVTLLGTVQTGGATATHTLCIDQTSGFLYRSGGDQNGLRIYSLANPANPVLVGTWNDRYVHEVTVITYPAGTPYAGKQIAICCGGFNTGWTNTGVSILDVTNKSSIQVLKHFTYPGAAYCHQAWPSADLKTLYIDDELDENGSNFTNTKVVDITNLSNPVLKTPFQNQSTAIGHNLYVKGNRIFEANYRSGLRVFDNTNPLQPTEIAWFDTWPEDDEAHFNGLWNVYPFFQSGVVIGSDIDRGLFVWWVGAPLIDFVYPTGAPDVLSPSGQQLVVNLNQAAPGTLVPGSQELHFDAGAGLAERAARRAGRERVRRELPRAAVRAERQLVRQRAQHQRCHLDRSARRPDPHPHVDRRVDGDLGRQRRARDGHGLDDRHAGRHGHERSMALRGAVRLGRRPRHGPLPWHRQDVRDDRPGHQREHARFARPRQRHDLARVAGDRRERPERPVGRLLALVLQRQGHGAQRGPRRAARPGVVLGRGGPWFEVETVGPTGTRGFGRLAAPHLPGRRLRGPEQHAARALRRRGHGPGIPGRGRDRRPGGDRPRLPAVGPRDLLHAQAQQPDLPAAHELGGRAERDLGLAVRAARHGGPEPEAGSCSSTAPRRPRSPSRGASCA
jgi:choice-of-anchor B domain-containing protein